MSVKFTFGGITACHRKDYFVVKSQHTFVVFAYKKLVFFVMQYDARYFRNSIMLFVVLTLVLVISNMLTHTDERSF